MLWKYPNLKTECAFCVERRFFTHKKKKTTNKTRIWIERVTAFLVCVKGMCVRSFALSLSLSLLLSHTHTYTHLHARTHARTRFFLFFLLVCTPHTRTYTRTHTHNHSAHTHVHMHTSTHRHTHIPQPRLRILLTRFTHILISSHAKNWSLLQNRKSRKNEKHSWEESDQIVEWYTEHNKRGIQWRRRNQSSFSTHQLRLTHIQAQTTAPNLWSVNLCVHCTFRTRTCP